MSPPLQVFDVAWLPEAPGAAPQLVTASHDHTWRAWAPVPRATQGAC